MATLTVRLLGGLRLECDGAVRQLASARAKAIVAYLLLHRGEPHERAQLAYLLWPESDERQARTNLRQVLHQLRRVLPESDGCLSLDGQQLEWRVDASIELDVERFEEAVASAARARDRGEVAHERASLEEAARLYRGDLLPEMYDPWLEQRRESLRQRYAAVLERLVTLAEGRLDYPGALQFAQRLVQHDPLVEAPYRRLMRLHALCGERAKALLVYHRCASLLQRELAVEPSWTTRATYEQMLQLQADGGPTAARPATSLQRPAAAPVVPLVGRAKELSKLQAAWRHASAGVASLTLVTGDSGIGKTRLVEEFARGLPRREAARVAVRCYGAEGALALAPVTAILRGAALTGALVELDPVWRREVGRLLPELADGRPPPYAGSAPGWQRQRLFEALARAVLACQPLLVTIDDLPWCDRDSLEWLRFLLRFDPHARMLVLATARTHEIEGNEALVAFLSALEGEELVSELELVPLSVVETAALARSLWRGEPRLEALAALFEETEGNPLFVVELLRAGWAGRTRRGSTAGVDAPATAPVARPEAAGSSAPLLPPKIRAVIASRFEQLSEKCLELMSIAAVIGREFGLELLVRVSHWDEYTVVRCLDELWQRRIVREVGAGRYYFSHDKLREVAQAALSRARRRLLHQDVAEALEVVGDDSMSAEIAYHFDRAGLAERAIPRYLRAAESARVLHAHEEALNAYQRALTLVEALPAGDVSVRRRQELAAPLFEGIGDVFALRGLHDEALEQFFAALERLPEIDRVGRARMLRKTGQTRVFQYRLGPAVEAFEQAETELTGAGTTEDEAWRQERIELGIARSDMYYWQHDWEANERVLRAIESAVMHAGTPVDRGRFLERLGYVTFGRHGFTGCSESVATVRAALAEFEQTDELYETTTARFLLGFALLCRGERAEANTHLQEALAATELMGDALMRVRCLTYLAFLNRIEGDLATTRAYAMRTLEAATRLGMPEYVGAARGQLAWLAWRRGDLDGCLREGQLALECWSSSRAYPLQWSARLPLLAALSTLGQCTEAVTQAASLLDPGLQRLSAALTEVLRQAVEAGGDAAARAALAHVIGLAEREGLL